MTDEELPKKIFPVCEGTTISVRQVVAVGKIEEHQDKFFYMIFMADGEEYESWIFHSREDAISNRNKLLESIHYA